MFCYECGKEIPDGINFCGYCGADLNAIKQQALIKTEEKALSEVDKSDDGKAEKKHPNKKRRIIPFAALLLFVLIIGFGAYSGWHIAKNGWESIPFYERLSFLPFVNVPKEVTYTYTDEPESEVIEEDNKTEEPSEIPSEGEASDEIPDSAGDPYDDTYSALVGRWFFTGDYFEAFDEPYYLIFHDDGTAYSNFWDGGTGIVTYTYRTVADKLHITVTGYGSDQVIFTPIIDGNTLELTNLVYDDPYTLIKDDSYDTNTGDTTIPYHLIEGRWYYADIHTEEYDTSSYIEFKADGTYINKHGANEYVGTYNINGNKLYHTDESDEYINLINIKADLMEILNNEGVLEQTLVRD